MWLEKHIPMTGGWGEGGGCQMRNELLIQVNVSQWRAEVLMKSRANVG